LVMLVMALHLLAIMISWLAASGFPLFDEFKSFLGQPLPPHEAQKAYAFNQHAATGEFDKLGYDQYRKQMTDAGLPGKRWHVGHIEPNVKGTPRSGRGAGAEDVGSNLFAQPSYDNRRLSHNTVSQAELKHSGRLPKGMGSPAIKNGEKTTTKAVEKGAAKGLEKSAVKGAEKAAVKGLEKAVVKGVEKGAAKGLEKAAVKGIEKGAVKAGGSALSKLAPGLGMAVAVAFAADRHNDGHHGQAAMEYASGVASNVPVFGTAAALAIDGANFVFDMFDMHF